MINLKGKVVLITGGSRGIGAESVRMFAESGCDVAFTYRTEFEAAKKLADKYGKKVKVKSYKTDLSQEADIFKTVENVLLDFKKIDILVNNAGIWNEGRIEELSLQDWRKMLEINLTGTFLFTQLVIPGMKENNFGRIINLSSTAGQRGEAEHSHYAATKGGINAFTKSLASELGPFGITVNAVAPGWVDTDMNVEVFSDKEYLETEKKEIPLRQIATAADIAGPILFLASDLANHITGEILNVNGGSVLCG
jgi:3-oxoacyl-[acyl-carrier protein] reductase